MRLEGGENLRQVALSVNTGIFNPLESLCCALDRFRLVRHIPLMRTATVADLRNHFPRVVAWLDQGEEIEILRCGKPVACLVPPRSGISGKVPKIDFAKQHKEIWGERVFSVQEVGEMRAFELEGEEG